MSGWNYVGKVGFIYVTTLTNANQWYQVLTEDQAKGIRGFKIKSRIAYGPSGAPTHVPRPFKYAFNSSPDETGSVDDGTGYWSNSGAGSGDEGGPSNGIWAASDVAGCIIEVLTYA